MRNPEKVILIFFVCLLIYSIVFLKIMGAYVETPVERQGYCKLNYGDEWRYKEGKCYNSKTLGESIILSESDFKDYCPKPQFISTTFWNKCFHANNHDYIN